MKYIVDISLPVFRVIRRRVGWKIWIRHSFGVNPNQKTMSTFTLIKDIYINAFRNIGNFIVKRYFKAFSIFSFIMFLIVLYAFIYRVYTGFPFE